MPEAHTITPNKVAQLHARGDSWRTSPTLLANYPFDILLYLANYLNLQDTISFLLVCATFKNLSNVRCLWIDLLKRTERVRPLPLPVGTCINDLPLVELQRIAQHASRLERNWRLSHPSVMGSIQARSHGGTIVIISIVPGTSLILVYRPDDSELICHDLDAPLAQISKHKVIGNVVEYAHYDKAGVQLVALLIEAPRVRSEYSLFVFGIEYGNGTAANLREYYSTPSPSSRCKDLYIWEDVVAVFPAPEVRTSLHAHITNFITNVSTTISIEIGFSIDPYSITCHVHDAIPYIVADLGAWGFSIHHFPTNQFPFMAGDSHILENTPDGSTDVGTLVAVALIEDNREQVSVQFAERWWSPMGLHALIFSIAEDADETGRGETWARLWPKGEENTPITECFDLEPISAYLYHVEGPIAWSPSGAYAVMVIKCLKSGSTLHLVEFLADPSRIERHVLDVPSYISLNEICSVAIDEGRGVIYLSSSKGHLFAIPYA